MLMTTATSAQNSALMALPKTKHLSSPDTCSSDSDNDANTNSPSSRTALRRLYFKSGRGPKDKTAVTLPKVVVMGSSRASVSETTINTSTESASTLVTSMTATDTSEACDSFDMGDNFGQNEPLLSSLDEPQQSEGSTESKQDVTELELTSAIFPSDTTSYFKNTSENIESSLSITSTPPIHHQQKQQQQQQHTHQQYSPCTSSSTNIIPRTAPISSSVHFPFDPPASPKSVRIKEKDQNLFSFKEATIYLEQQKHEHEKFDNHQHKQLQNSQQQQHQKGNIMSDKEMRSSWNQKNQNLQQTNNEFSSNNSRCRTGATTPISNISMMSDKIKDEYLIGSRYSEHQIPEKFEMNEVCKGEKKEIKTKMKSNRYMNTNFKKERPNSGQNKLNSSLSVLSKDKHFTLQKHTSNTLTPTNICGGRNSYDYDKKDLTMFPFDREAIDYNRIRRECYAVEEGFKFPYEIESNTDSDSDDASIYERKTFNSPLKSSRNDIFQQYTLLSQQESYERRYSKKNRPDLIHMKYDHIAKSDAFTPQQSIDISLSSSSSSSSPKQISELHKFEQIVSKFEQIPPKYHNDTKSGNCQQFHGSNNNLSKNSISPSQAILNNTKNVNGVSGTNNITNTGGIMTCVTPPLPDLRIDFFSENAPSTSTTQQQQQQQQHHHHQKQQQQQQQQHHHQHDILDKCQKLPLAIGCGSINVTANPMETAVCTQPRATIVVQQPSLSLDNTVETLLLRNEGDFVSVEQAKESKKKKQQREENIKQLLDVTNTLTFEELRDFEMRYGSPHHSRSQSVKTPGRASGRPNQLSLPQQRSRVASMPNTGVEEEYYRLRHFSITGKGVVNRGDSLKSRRSRSNNSVASSNSSNEHLNTSTAVIGSAKTSATCSLASSRESSTSNPGNGPYRVLMLGSAAVGKSSLVSQFMTSEYLHAYDTSIGKHFIQSIDDESGEKSVSVLLSGEESELIFIDHAYSEISPENCISSYDPHGYCVIYSSAERSSFIVAERVLQTLWTTENVAQKAVILVGNKADLARSRVVSSDEGKAMATAYDCKFIETSVGINHNVDELLVGLLSQIRLKLENPEKSRDLFRKRSSRKSKRRACSPLGGTATACLTGNSGTNLETPLEPPVKLISEYNIPPGSAHSSPRKYRGSRSSASLKVKGLLGRVWARDSKSKSCENLHVL